MKKRLKFLIVIGLLFNVSFVFAQDLSFDGYLKLDKRVLFEDTAPMLPMYNILFLEMKYTPEDYDDMSLVASGQFRSYDFSTAGSLDEMSESYYYDFLLWEAYANLYSLFGIDGLDVTIGKQRIAWGVADKMNPTDNLNPDDFSDFTNFGEKVPSWAIKLNYNFYDDYVLTYIWEPKANLILTPTFTQLPFLSSISPFNAASTTTNLVTPNYNLEKSMHAVKLATNLLGVDVSLSYFHGYDDLPIVKQIDFNQATNAQTITLVQPELNVVGFDAKADIAGAGLWFEGALFMPEEIDLTMNIYNGANLIKTTQVVALDNSPYYKYTIGGDYNFGDNWYINVQYVKGFFIERGDDIHDYVFARVEKKVYYEKIKFALGGALEFNGSTDDNFGNGVFPEIEYKPNDNLEMKVGAYIFNGKGDALLYKMKGLSQLYASLKMYF